MSPRSSTVSTAPSLSTTTRSLTARSSGYSDEMKITPLPSSARLGIMSRISDLVPMSPPAVGSSMMSTSGSVPSHLAMTTFCWLPPDSTRTGLAMVATFTENRWIRERASSLPLRSLISGPAFNRLSSGSSRLSRTEWSRTRPCSRRSSGISAIPTAGAARGVPGVAEVPAPAVQPYLPAVELVDPEQDARQLRTTAAHQAGQAEDLALVQLERDVADPPTGVESLSLQQHFPGAPRRTLLVLELALDLLPDDALHDLLAGDLLERLGEQPPAVAQDGDPVGDPVHLLHPVRDVDDRYAPRLEALDQFEQRLGLVLGEARGGLVHDEDPGVLRERLGDLRQLPVRGAEVLHASGHVDLDVHAGNPPPRPRARLRVVDHAEPPHRLGRQEDVLRY